MDRRCRRWVLPFKLFPVSIWYHKLITCNVRMLGEKLDFLHWLLSFLCIQDPSHAQGMQVSHAQSSYPASLINGLFSRIFLP